MNVIDALHNAFLSFLSNSFELEHSQLSDVTFDINTDEQKQHFGDITSNAPLVLAKHLGKNPKNIATIIDKNFHHELLERIDVAGPGFINIFLQHAAFVSLMTQLYSHPKDSLKPTIKNKKKYSLEFVSANPTGPLHLGHGRGGIIGDVLAKILRFIGHNVTTEYYINDAGSQIQKLGLSLKIRCQQALGYEATLPENAYHGEYLIDLAKTCIEEHGKAVLDKPDPFFADYAKNHILAMIKQTLHDYGITFDIWFSEKTLHESGAIRKALEHLKDRSTTYEQDDALWFKSTKYGDDKDRVLRKSNGELTYISADIAYLEDKFKRADYVIYILGQDHHSYVVRLKGIAQALGYNPDLLEVILYQLVTLQDEGKLLRMSKRTGTMVTLREVIDTVGKDVARFFFLNRKADAHLDFDLSLALKKTEENPVYYIQYAYVRTNSILHKAQEKDELQNINENDAIGIAGPEHLMLKKIISLRVLLSNISGNFHTHLLTYYVLELAQLFHAYYNHNRVIDLDNIPQSRARLLLIQLLRNTFALCLDLLGLDKPKKM